MICLKGVGYCGFFGGCGFSKLLLCRFSSKTGKEKLIKNKLILRFKKLAESCYSRHFADLFVIISRCIEGMF